MSSSLTETKKKTNCDNAYLGIDESDLWIKLHHNSFSDYIDCTAEAKIETKKNFTLLKYGQKLDLFSTWEPNAIINLEQLTLSEKNTSTDIWEPKKYLTRTIFGMKYLLSSDSNLISLEISFKFNDWVQNKYHIKYMIQKGVQFININYLYDLECRWDVNTNVINQEKILFENTIRKRKQTASGIYNYLIKTAPQKYFKNIKNEKKCSNDDNYGISVHYLCKITRTKYQR